MDLLTTKIDTLLNNTNVSFDLNECLYQNKDYMFLSENIAEKEIDATFVKNEKMSVSPTIKSGTSFDVDSTDEFEDCVIYSNEESSETSEDNITIDDETTMTSCEEIQNFIKECELSSDDEISNQDKIDIRTNKIETRLEIDTAKNNNNSLIVANEIQRNTDAIVMLNHDIANIEDEPLKKLILENDLLLQTEPDYKELEDRINSLWKEIENIQLQVQEERQLAKAMRSEMKEYVANYKNVNNINDISITDDDKNSIIMTNFDKVVAIDFPDNLNENIVVTKCDNIELQKKQESSKEMSLEIQKYIDSYHNINNTHGQIITENDNNNIMTTNDIDSLYNISENTPDTLYEDNTETIIERANRSNEGNITTIAVDMNSTHLCEDSRLSKRTEEKIKAKKEVIKNMKQNELNSESYMFGKKLDEVKQFCTSEIDKISSIISQLTLMENTSEFNNVRNKRNLLRRPY